MKREKDKLIEFIHLENGQMWNPKTGDNKIIIVMDGEIYTSSSTGNETKVTAYNMIFFPFQDKVSVKATKASKIVLIRFSNHSEFCGILSSFDHSQEHEEKITLLSIKSVIVTYIQTLEEYANRGIDNHNLLDLKLKEFWYILKSFYPEKYLQGFFKMLAWDDLLFSEQVHTYLTEIRSVRQLAEKMNYSYSGFNKRFRRVFNISAYSWVRNHRAKQVYQDICETNKSLKEISTSHKFMTLSHFNEFCHKNLGKSPSEIRRKRKQEAFKKNTVPSLIK
ncbi:AraC family transcriptional regulator [Dysgonomonas sp. 520]|uniref:helix-turn-helix domain-containing protein n=1 Tax=Dysgonomonas sp. 520 TaxID=2302931 RepID=UPI0013D61479|nr:helix-turn-helix transcriptional regulator [Dysgonomonas sp. 520]NDW10859.1 AraC family transcriptional regulator [Dysgonomonas sp. 520]